MRIRRLVGRRLLGAILAACTFCAPPLLLAEQASIPGGQFKSVLPPSPQQDTVSIVGFLLDTVPVTNKQFADFVRTHPEWRRDRVSRLFADDQYLSQWPSADRPEPSAFDQPVTRVSWFAASAYCEAQGGRLPTWYEWEYVAAASETSRDARQDPTWRQRILSWYEKPALGRLPPVGKTPANIYGIRDLHGVVWEWVDDFNSILVSGDNRQQGDPDTLKFCGAGALSLQDKENYAVLMRTALFSSLQGHYTTASLGFRCAGDVEENKR